MSEINKLVDRLIDNSITGLFIASRKGDQFFSYKTNKSYTKSELIALKENNPDLEMQIFNNYDNAKEEPFFIEGANVINIGKSY